MPKNLQKEIQNILFELLRGPIRPITEEMIGKRLGISRTPVRQVLKKLEIEGLIEQKRKKGICLRSMSVEELLQLYDVRAVLEGFAGKLICKIGEKDDIEELNNLAIKFTRAFEKGQMDSVDQLDLQFHRKIVQMSGNIHLLKIMKDLSIIERVFMLEKEIKSSGGETPVPTVPVKEPIPHELIVETIKRGDCDECEKLLRLHIQYSKQKTMETN
ncbi:MAG: GntR family transcriptional regulator [Spirochaetia bacterium]|nr:GntR family transcriptional regulator [Spirochaetia bacterium]